MTTLAAAQRLAEQAVRFGYFRTTGATEAKVRCPVCHEWVTAEWLAIERPRASGVVARIKRAVVEHLRDPDHKEAS